MNKLPSWLSTSGNILGDRAYNYSLNFIEEKDWQAAFEMLHQTIERSPNWPPAYFSLGKVCLELLNFKQAKQDFEKALELDSEDYLGVRVYLTKINNEHINEAFSKNFISKLFDDYAPNFDNHLVSKLEYCAPQKIKTLLEKNSKVSPYFNNALDLGCGTGLMAKALEGCFNKIIGLDLSQKMLAEAQKTKLYERLICIEILEGLKNEQSSFDLVLAADVFCYIPDLSIIFEEIKRILTIKGKFIFSIETHDGDGVIIGDDYRAQHSCAQIRKWCNQSGLEIIDEEETSTRKEQGNSLPGAIFLLQKSN